MGIRFVVFFFILFSATFSLGSDKKQEQPIDQLYQFLSDNVLNRLSDWRLAATDITCNQVVCSFVDPDYFSPEVTIDNKDKDRFIQILKKLKIVNSNDFKLKEVSCAVKSSDQKLNPIECRVIFSDGSQQSL